MSKSKLLGLVLASTLVLGACGSSDPEEEDTPMEEETEQVADEEVEEVEEIEEIEEVEEVEEAAVAGVEVYDEFYEPTREQKDARTEAFKHLPLVEPGNGHENAEHLEEQGYSEDAIHYAIAELKLAALSVLETKYSPGNLGNPEVDESEHAKVLASYPQEAIDYALDNLNVDYDEQALMFAKTLQGSDKQVKEEILAKGFTEEQAQYAMDNLE